MKELSAVMNFYIIAQCIKRVQNKKAILTDGFLLVFEILIKLSEQNANTLIFAFLKPRVWGQKKGCVNIGNIYKY
jgi:hypothetical protein